MMVISPSEKDIANKEADKSFRNIVDEARLSLKQVQLGESSE